MDGWTVVCRCEEISRGEIDEAISAGAHTPDDVKRWTRCGMGHCQGKYCEPTVQAILSSVLPAGEAPLMRLRPPIRPVSLGTLFSGNPPGGPASFPERWLEPAPKSGEHR